jgi:hypothetical protein
MLPRVLLILTVHRLSDHKIDIIVITVYARGN